jgi:hypothetical protein
MKKNNLSSSRSQQLNDSKLTLELDSLDMASIRRSPENEKLYKPVSRDDPDIQALAASVKERGIMEPLVVTKDGYIVSGHRRFMAGCMVGLVMFPCRVCGFRKADNPDLFLRLLREFNRQREKSVDEIIREQVVSASPQQAYKALIEHRANKSRVSVPGIALRSRQTRLKISKAKQPLLEAIISVVEDRRDYLPISVRSLHYGLLNNPPLKHASKRNSTYKNDKPSYQALVELVTRARLEGHVSMDAIADETRPVENWTVWNGVGDFVRNEIDGMFNDYFRNLMASQPNHIEIVAEKNTVHGIVKQVAGKYSIPVTSARGHCSLPPRYEMSERFKKSGKEKLIVLILSDFDPDGEEIAHSFARSMRDDFGIDDLHAVKVALTAQQVRRFRLPPNLDAKESSPNFKRFAQTHGRAVYELEALQPDDLKKILQDAIDGLIDVKAFNAELEREKSDAAQLAEYRQRVQIALRGLNGAQTP